ncbi:MAG: hypothetical protein KJP21_06075 [Bacteroidia bacterium]|nr:hypothetical protein [Bacteroidia bacterium]NNJ55914.1 hypothetical protein [Bacteroidia bacterium]
MENQKYLSELHKEHIEWRNQLNFVKDEIKTYKNRLSDVVSKNSKTEVLALAEHFQNQFIRHDEVIDTLLHDINEEEHKIVLMAKDNNVATDHRKADENEKLVDRMQIFDKIYKGLKNEYLEYLTKVM